uniref:TonB-dependent receptor domain-containing protein n=1 Tax=Chitinimonas sp. TaxID=1934313 RepID=UPI0035B35F1E
KGYYASSTDYYQCGLSGQPLDKCEFANVSPGANYTENASKNLKSETGKSGGIGVVWSPAKQFDLTADYWQIRIDNLVTQLNADTLLRTEADCRLGKLDAKSAQCQDVISRITRNPANAPLDPLAIRDIRVNSINAASEKTDGIDLSARLGWKSEQWGDYQWRINYTRVLSHKYQQFASDAERDLLHAKDNSDWPDKLINSLSWNKASWNSTLTLIRNGRIPNAAQDGGYVEPIWLTNLDIGYQINKQASVSLTINNLFDKIRRDTSGGWPYYLVGNYLPYGREGWVQLNYHFN